MCSTFIVELHLGLRIAELKITHCNTQPEAFIINEFHCREKAAIDRTHAHVHAG